MTKRIIAVERCGGCPYMDGEIWGDDFYRKCRKEHGRIIEGEIPAWCSLVEAISYITPEGHVVSLREDEE